MRRISQKVSQKIHQIRNMTKKEKQPSESTVPAVSKIRKNDISGPVLAEIQLGEGNNVP